MESPSRAASRLNSPVGEKDTGLDSPVDMTDSENAADIYLSSRNIRTVDSYHKLGNICDTSRACLDNSLAVDSCSSKDVKSSSSVSGRPCQSSHASSTKVSSASSKLNTNTTDSASDSNSGHKFRLSLPPQGSEHSGMPPRPSFLITDILGDRLSARSKLLSDEKETVDSELDPVNLSEDDDTDDPVSNRGDEDDMSSPSGE